MPAILSQDEEKWLDPKLGNSDIEQLLLPFSADRMDAYIIDNNFLNKSVAIQGIIPKRPAKN